MLNIIKKYISKRKKRHSNSTIYSKNFNETSCYNEKTYIPAKFKK